MTLFRPLLVAGSATLVFATLLISTPASARGLRVNFGIVRGSVTMSALCPTAPCTITGNPYANYQVTLTGTSGLQFTFPIRKNGGFSGFAAPGAYTINITPNHWQPICSADGICNGGVGSANVPADFTVLKNQINNFNIVIDTGVL